MEYIEHCPNCGQQVIVEEEGAVYVIKNNKGDVIISCPSCHKILTVKDGVMTIKNDTV